MIELINISISMMILQFHHCDCGICEGLFFHHLPKFHALCKPMYAYLCLDHTMVQWGLNPTYINWLINPFWWWFYSFIIVIVGYVKDYFSNHFSNYHAFCKPIHAFLSILCAQITITIAMPFMLWYAFITCNLNHCLCSGLYFLLAYPLHSS